MKNTTMNVLVFLIVLMSLISASVVFGESLYPQLTDISQIAGIDFTHSIGDEKLSNIVESAGAGVCFSDYDNDGDMDIYFVNGAYHPDVNHPKGRRLEGKLSNALFANNGYGLFKNVTDISGVGDNGVGMAALFADYDNDGDQDLYVTNYGPNRMYQNQGDGTFVDVTVHAGVGCELWSLGCTFFDYDNDGWLDLYVGNYLSFDPDYQYYYAGDGFPGPLAYKGQPDVLYRNNGDGTFTDVTRKAGLYNPDGRAMGVSSCDFNHDGFMDIFIANDAMENYMYKNNGDGTFDEIALPAGTAFGQNGEATSAMSPEFGDIDLDGKLDILIPDMGYSCLYLYKDVDFYSEISAVSGLASICGQYTSWSGNFFDFNCDGQLDVLITNGDSHFYEPEEDLILTFTKNKRFKNISSLLGPDFKRKGMGRGSAVGDIDNDGDLDVLITNINGRPALYRNDGGNKHHWLMLDLRGKDLNRDAIGARVALKMPQHSLIRQKMSSSGYLSQSDHRLHFGLGKHPSVKQIDIIWPNGKTSQLKKIAVDRVMVINEPN